MLDGQQVRLRPYRKTDLQAAYNTISKPSVRRLLAGNALLPMRYEDEEEWYAGLSKDPNPTFAIERLSDGVYLGGASIVKRDQRNRVAELGIMIDEPFWSQGYGREAFALLIDYAFSEFNLHKVKLSALSWNPRALHVYERLGFREEGRLREEVCLNHQFYDMVLMGMLHSEWLVKRSEFLQTEGFGAP